MAAGWGSPHCKLPPCPAPARSGTLRAAVAADHAQRLIPGALGLHLAPGRPGPARRLPGHPGLEAPRGAGGGRDPQAALGPLRAPAAQPRFCSRSMQKGALPWSPCKAQALGTRSAAANADLNRSGRRPGEVEAAGETLLPGKSDPKKGGQSNKPAPSLGDVTAGCHLPAPLPAGGTTANRTSKGPTTAR